MIRRETCPLGDETYSRLQKLITERFRANWTKSLIDVHSLDPDFLSVGPDGVGFLVSHREELLDVFADPETFADLVNLFVEMALEFSYKSNQFIRITELERERLEEVYRSYLRKMERLIAEEGTVESLTRSLELLVRDHFVELRSHLDRLPGEGVPRGADNNVFLTPVVCKEYSPALQLSILAIDPTELVEPILDIGCGRAGELVRHLRRLGLAAFGVDRLVEGSSYLMKADWVHLPMEPGSWGTVISHMAFSNHFIFQHLYRFGAPEEYARQYTSILASLKPGGSFFYSPGLPFIEKYLAEEEFSVRRHSIRLSTSHRDPAGAGRDNGLPHSTQITRNLSGKALGRR